MVIESRRMRWVEHIASMGGMRNKCHVSQKTSQGETLGLPRHGWSEY
jgi:hypothetical protein